MGIGLGISCKEATPLENQRHSDLNCTLPAFALFLAAKNERYAGELWYVLRLFSYSACKLHNCFDKINKILFNRRGLSYLLDGVLFNKFLFLWFR